VTMLQHADSIDVHLAVLQWMIALSTTVQYIWILVQEHVASAGHRDLLVSLLEDGLALAGHTSIQTASCEVLCVLQNQYASSVERLSVLIPALLSDLPDDLALSALPRTPDPAQTALLLSHLRLVHAVLLGTNPNGCNMSESRVDQATQGTTVLSHDGSLGPTDYLDVIYGHILTLDNALVIAQYAILHRSPEILSVLLISMQWFEMNIEVILATHSDSLALLADALTGTHTHARAGADDSSTRSLLAFFSLLPHLSHEATQKITHAVLVRNTARATQQHDREDKQIKVVGYLSICVSYCMYVCGGSRVIWVK
jgi:hypothetical protein